MDPINASKCPLCKKATVFEFRPFCSKRCAAIDLARWLRGDYRIEDDEEKQETDTDKTEDTHRT